MASLRMPGWSAPASHRLVPTNRNKPIWAMMNTPDPISARCASFKPRAASNRCTNRCSVPCVAADNRTQAAYPCVEQRHQTDCEDPETHAPVGDDGEGDRRREHPHAIGDGASEQEYSRRRASRGNAEAALEPLVGGILRSVEIARQQQVRDADAANQVA